MRENRCGDPRAIRGAFLCFALSQAACTAILGDFEASGSVGSSDATAPGSDGGNPEGPESGADGASSGSVADGATGGTLRDAAIDGGCPDGAASGACAPSCPLAGKAASMIDDGSEPGSSASILTQCGRMGVWYTNHDPTSSQTPDNGLPVPRATANPPNGVPGYVETYGVLSNSGLSGPYGAAIGFDLDKSSGVAQSYDALSPGYSGISFWIRITQPASTQPYLLFQVTDAQTGPTVNGEYYWQYRLPTPPANAWTHYSVHWSDLKQTIMSESALDVRTLRSVYWQFNETSPGSNTAQPFDVSVGDIAFMP